LTVSISTTVTSTSESHRENQQSHRHSHTDQERNGARPEKPDQLETGMPKFTGIPGRLQAVKNYFQALFKGFFFQ
jgi:hypothetical protein